ncbi:hypothetical protein M3B46_14700 [Sphingobacterium daejeonense]|uniref:hypothetical protein n=1 Tax=Sphingobacterium daejeonense TaxID=371142 RepID=UPI0021A4BD8D|nr:hypothetical protein [Sphingobacterium daejeonense]MCT1532249.1 hypothetical protein [Sphingobacterium daejeonense]
MSNFKIEVTSVHDREKLVVEIWYKENLIAEINQELQSLEIEFYTEGKATFDLRELLEAIEIAKMKLLNHA